MLNRYFKKRILSAGLLLMISVQAMAIAVAAKTKTIEGLWVMPDGSALIEVYKLKQTMAVRIVALRDTTFTVADESSPLGQVRRDIHNPDARLQNRSLINLNIAWGLTHQAGRWAGGEIYDPGSGNTYSCELELASDGFLRVRGYMGFSLLGRTLYWQRAAHFEKNIRSMLKTVTYVP